LSVAADAPRRDETVRLACGASVAAEVDVVRETGKLDGVELATTIDVVHE
jgi:hypothetical protein